MSLEELKEIVGKLTNSMSDSCDLVTDAAIQAQERIYLALLDQINRFEITDGRYVTGQNYARRIAIIQGKINAILGGVYIPAIREYLSTYSTIEETQINLHRDYNELVIAKSLLTPARRSVYDQAEYYLIDGLADAYIQPAKYLLMQQVTTGQSIEQSRRLLKNWNDGELGGGKLASARPTPNLNHYATQIARDSIFQYNGTINDIIATKYKLDSGIYVGDLIKDSRPFCKHMVNLNRKIKITEIPQLLIKYPDGIIPNTTMENFPIRRGGYACRHTWQPVKSRVSG